MPRVAVWCAGEDGVRGRSGCGWKGRREATYRSGAPPRLYAAGTCPKCGYTLGSDTVRPPQCKATWHGIRCERERGHVVSHWSSFRWDTEPVSPGQGHEKGQEPA